MTDNPLLKESSLDLHYPPFDKIKDEHFAPAYEEGMAEQMKEIAPIASNPEPPTFENTIVALEKSGDLLGRVDRIFSNLASCNTNPQMQKIETEMAPKLAAHEDAIHLDPALLARVDALYQNARRSTSTPNRCSCWSATTRSSCAPAPSSRQADKARLKALNAELATLHDALQAERAQGERRQRGRGRRRADLDGLSTGRSPPRPQAAAARGLDGKWVIALQNTTGQPALAQLKNRALRERIYEASLARGRGGATDNRAIIAHRQAARRARGAAGLSDHAAYQLEDQTAGNVETVQQPAGQAGAAGRGQRARARPPTCSPLIDKEKGGFKFGAVGLGSSTPRRCARRATPSTSRSSSRISRLNRVLAGRRLLRRQHSSTALPSRSAHDLPVYHPDVRVFEVFDADGSPLALFPRRLLRRDPQAGRRLDERLCAAVRTCCGTSRWWRTT